MTEEKTEVCQRHDCDDATLTRVDMYRDRRREVVACRMVNAVTCDAGILATAIVVLATIPQLHQLAAAVIALAVAGCWLATRRGLAMDDAAYRYYILLDMSAASNDGGSHFRRIERCANAAADFLFCLLLASALYYVVFGAF